MFARRTLLLVAGVLPVLLCGCNERSAFEPPLLIAHAGGEISGATYTNSLEALDTNYGRGHRVFEIDLNFTSDGELVLIHDWSDAYRELFEQPPPGVPTLAEFEGLTMRRSLSHLTLTDLMGWLERNPEAYIVTDVKSRNLEGLRRIRDRFEDHRARFIPQIYSMEELEPVKAMGYEHIILTLYRTDVPNEQILEFAEANDLFAFTMTPRRGTHDNLALELRERGEIVYFYTVNSVATARKLIDQGAYGYYTDTLSF